MSLSDQLKKAIKASGKTRYAVATGSKVDHAVLRRFLANERDIKLTTAEKIASYLGLELKKSSKTK